MERPTRRRSFFTFGSTSFSTRVLPKLDLKKLFGVNRSGSDLLDLRHAPQTAFLVCVTILRASAPDLPPNSKSSNALLIVWTPAFCSTDVIPRWRRNSVFQ